MKKLICSMCVSGLVLATTALGADKNQGNGESVAGRPHRSAQSATSVAPASSRHMMSAPRTKSSVSKPQVGNQTSASTRRVRSNAMTRNNATVRNNARVRSNVANARVRNNAKTTARNNTVNSKVRNNVAMHRERNFTRNRNVAVGSTTAINRNRTRSAVVTNNWRGSRFSGQNYAVFRNYHRQWHDRGWWTSHYNNIVFVSGGWWYWNAGYWFPAWGYAPGAYYPYDGPIYGYSNLNPNQVVVNVQTQLSRDGYYTGPIDGSLGPMTRQAIAAYQADNGLAVTSTVDEPTMSSLGLT